MAFGAKYAQIYDDLYKDKDYAKEAAFALDQIRKIRSGKGLHILDLGCGTGMHAVYLAQAGMSVTGVDHSKSMILLAKKRMRHLSDDLHNRLNFLVGDIRTFTCSLKFDAVISLFHVMSYLYGDDDLTAAFRTVRRHLNVGRPFIFDFWYGPAILQDPPKYRTKIIQIGTKKIERKTIPEWDPTASRVCVNYKIEINDIVTQDTVREEERHVVRYFFREEIATRLDAAGFEVVHFGEWLTEKPPSDATFGVYVLAKAK